MPIPVRKKGEKAKAFTSRCMGNATMKKEFKGRSQRFAVCQNQGRRRKNARRR